MEMSSSIPSAASRIEAVGLGTALSAVLLDVTAAETAVAAALKKELARVTGHGKAWLRLFQDLDHPAALNYSIWVKKMSVGFGAPFIQKRIELIEHNLVRWLQQTGQGALQDAEELGMELVLVDGLKVKLREVSDGAYSLSLNITYTFQEAQ